MWEYAKTLLGYDALPGGMAGIAAFFWALRAGHYRNNSYLSKFLVEVGGAMTTAWGLTPFVAGLLGSQNAKKASLAFLIGLGWPKIVQMCRAKITTKVEEALARQSTRPQQKQQKGKGHWKQEGSAASDAFLEEVENDEHEPRELLKEHGKSAPDASSVRGGRKRMRKRQKERG